jgi:hypothetical protein
MPAVKDSLPAPSREGEESERPRSTGTVEPTASILPIESEKRITEADRKGLLGSRNAWPEKGGIGSRQTILLARRTRTMKRCSFDARSEGQSGDSLGREGVTVQRKKQEAFARLIGTSGKSIAKQSEGGRMRKLDAAGDHSASTMKREASDASRTTRYGSRHRARTAGGITSLQFAGRGHRDSWGC